MEGDNRAEKYMRKVKDELERSGLTGQLHISVYNRCYEAVMNVLRESDIIQAKYDKSKRLINRMATVIGDSNDVWVYDGTNAMLSEAEAMMREDQPTA